jgi:hypothetical protein
VDPELCHLIAGHARQTLRGLQGGRGSRDTRRFGRPLGGCRGPAFNSVRSVTAEGGEMSQVLPSASGPSGAGPTFLEGLRSSQFLIGFPRTSRQDGE